MGARDGAIMMHDESLRRQGYSSIREAHADHLEDDPCGERSVRVGALVSRGLPRRSRSCPDRRFGGVQHTF